jgi:heat shock protein HslJ
MKRLAFIFSLFLVTPVSAAEITSKIVDSVQLSVQGAAVQSTRMGGQYSVSGSNINVTTLGGVGTAGSYGINTNGGAFSFSESSVTADTVVTTQSAASGTIASPNLYSNSTTQLGGDKGTLAGTLSGTGVPTVTAGGPGSTATAQRTIELSVFK